MSEIRVLIVEDEPMIAEDIRDILDGIDYKVSAIAFDSVDALTQLQNDTPDIVLLDINLNSEMDGVQIAEEINRLYKLPFIFITSYADKATIERVKYTRPMGYIVKPFDERDIFTAMEIALFNYARISVPIDLNIEKINSNLLAKITAREFEILCDIYMGMTNKQMTEKHFVSLNTVKTHIKNIYDKLDVHTRSKAIARVRQLCT